MSKFLEWLFFNTRHIISPEVSLLADTAASKVSFFKSFLQTAPDDPHLPEYFGFLRHLLTRQFQPLHRITISAINDEAAAKSPYVNALQISFNAMSEGENVILYRKMGAATQ